MKLQLMLIVKAEAQSLVPSRPSSALVLPQSPIAIIPLILPLNFAPFHIPSKFPIET